VHSYWNPKAERPYTIKLVEDKEKPLGKMHFKVDNE
jgi:hypothetical protein